MTQTTERRESLIARIGIGNILAGLAYLTSVVICIAPIVMQ